METSKVGKRGSVVVPARLRRKFGIKEGGLVVAEERPDGFSIHGTGAPRGGVADAHDDHRIAMALAIAALSASGPSTIDGSEAVAISYPGFFDTLGRLVA